MNTEFNTTTLIIIIVVAAVFSIGFARTCYWMAGTKGKNKKLWAAAGLLFGLLAIAVLAASPAEKTPDDEAPDPVTLLTELEEQRDKGEITEQQFQERKERLLSGK